MKDPRLYNSKNKSAGSGAITVAPEPELDLTGGVDAFDETEEWYNKSDEGFPHTDFERMSLVGTYFNNSNVPVYAMQAGDVWAARDTAKGEFVHAKAPDTEGQGYGISNVHWYQYRSRNPLYDHGGNYNTKQQSTEEGNPKLSRFYFYRFTGDTLSPSLDNFLFAVDTYSKLMFAFARPTASKNVFGNNVPTAWGPTDSEPYKDGTVYQFYMYDPVGYVEKKDGTYNVVMYQWFKDNLAKGVYQPTLGEAGKEVASKKPDGAGTSPFNNHTVDNFAINMKLFAGKTFMYREKLANGGYGLKLYTFTISADGKTLTRKTTVWNGLEEAPADVVYTIGAGESSTKGEVSGGDGKLKWLEVKDEGQTLVLSSSETATTSFQDYGPQFLERVRHNPTYKSTDGSDTYVFKAGSPNKLIMDGEEYTYAGTADHTNRTIYERNGWYYGVELTGNDFTVKMTSRSGYHAIQWYTLGWAADLVEEKKASFCDNVLNHSFMFRPKDDTGDGLYLYTWEFSDNGKKVSLKKTPWQKTQEATSVSGVSVSDGGQDGLKGTAGGATFTLSADLGTITVSGCSDPNGNGTFSRSYSDPGPSFLNRVKGATYSRGKTKYTFSADGKKLTMEYEKFGTISSFPYLGYYIETNEYTYDPNKDNDVGNQFANYGGYRVQLTKNDTVINIATLPNVGGASVMEYGADRH